MLEPAGFCLHFLRQNRAGQLYINSRSSVMELGPGPARHSRTCTWACALASSSCCVLGFGNAVQFWATEGTQTEQKQRRGTERANRDWRESSSCRVLRFGSAFQFWAAEGTQTEQKQRRGIERQDRDWRERAIDSKNSSYPAVLQIVCW